MDEEEYVITIRGRFMPQQVDRLRRSLNMTVGVTSVEVVEYCRHGHFRHEERDGQWKGLRSDGDVNRWENCDDRR